MKKILTILLLSIFLFSCGESVDLYEISQEVSVKNDSILVNTSVSYYKSYHAAGTFNVGKIIYNNNIPASSISEIGILSELELEKAKDFTIYSVEASTSKLKKEIKINK
jgi:hypothetical protein